jgi:hypothetical protein
VTPIAIQALDGRRASWDEEAPTTKEPHMTLDQARQRIETAVTQYGQHAAPAIDLVMAEVRSDMGAGAFNELVEDFDLELLYNIAPMESDHSNS